MRESQRSGHRRELLRPQVSRSPAPLRGREGKGHSTPVGLSKDVTSFLFLNFPSNWETIHPWKLFKRFGRVVDVYIAKKYLRNGKQFGFVRFSGVRDILNMEISLNTIWIGFFKLRVFIAKPRPDSFENLVKEFDAGNKHVASPLFRGPISGGVESRSYAQVVGGRVEEAKSGESSIPIPGKPHKSILGGEPHNSIRVSGDNRRQSITRSVGANRLLCLDSNHDIIEYLKSCIVWISKDLVSVDEVESCWVAEGVDVTEVKYLHGLVFLVKLVNEAAVDKIVSNKDHSIHHHSSVLKKWDNSISTARRLAEIEIRGLPITAWSEDIFHKIASRWGEVLGLKNCSFREAGQLEAGIASILTDKPSRISSCIQIDVGGVIFRIIVEERSSSISFLSQREGSVPLGQFSDSEGSLIDSDLLESSFHDPDLDEEEIRSSGGIGMDNSGNHDHVFSADEQHVPDQLGDQCFQPVTSMCREPVFSGGEKPLDSTEESAAFPHSRSQDQCHARIKNLSHVPINVPHASLDSSPIKDVSHQTKGAPPGSHDKHGPHHLKTSLNSSSIKILRPISSPPSPHLEPKPTSSCSHHGLEPSPKIGLQNFQINLVPFFVSEKNNHNPILPNQKKSSAEPDPKGCPVEDLPPIPKQVNSVSIKRKGPAPRSFFGMADRGVKGRLLQAKFRDLAKKKNVRSSSNLPGYSKDKGKSSSSIGSQRNRARDVEFSRELEA